MENILDIQIGDLVDFGAYGKLYIANDLGDKFWVTDDREERDNSDALGWYISKDLAEEVLEEYEY